MGTRIFSAQLHDRSPAGRTVDNDAPMGFRLELIDAVFRVADNSFGTVSHEQLYRVMVQSMGVVGAARNPMAGHRNGSANAIQGLEWPRVYDLICRWWFEFPLDVQGAYVRAVNEVLAGNRISWLLREDGTLARVLPVAVQAQVDATFQELSEPRFQAALTSLQEAMQAYNDRPQRGRDACGNAFDALESVGKHVYNLPTRTFGDVLNEMRRQQARAGETISVLQKLYDMANSHFRHGMTTPFALASPEVDFVVRVLYGRYSHLCAPMNGQVMSLQQPHALVALTARATVLFVPNKREAERFFGFFTENFRNTNTRRAYYKAVCRFSDLDLHRTKPHRPAASRCQGQGLGEFGKVKLMHVAAYIELLGLKKPDGEGLSNHLLNTSGRWRDDVASLDEYSKVG